MKFFGTGKVWDTENKCDLCEFKKTGIRQGELETTDKRIIDILKSMGYKYEITEKDLEEARNESKKTIKK